MENFSKRFPYRQLALEVTFPGRYKCLQNYFQKKIMRFNHGAYPLFISESWYSQASVTRYGTLHS